MSDEDPGPWAPPKAALVDQAVVPGATRGFWPSLVRIVFGLSLVPSALGLVSQVGGFVQALLGTYAASLDEMVLSLFLCLPSWGTAVWTSHSSALGRRVARATTWLLSIGCLLLAVNWALYAFRAL